MKAVHASFWTAAIGSSLMTIALVLPTWLGRRYAHGTLELYGVFYHFKCLEGACESRARILDNDVVPLEGREWDIQIEALVAFGFIGLVFCFIAVTILEAISCRCCGDRMRTKRVLICVTGLLVLSALSTTLTVIIGIYMCSKYYKDNKISEAAEFPWSLLVTVIADVLILLAAVLFIYILWNWDKYYWHYGYRRSWDLDHTDGKNNFRYSSNGMRRKASHRHSTDRYNNGGYAESGFTGFHSQPGIYRSQSSRFNFPGFVRMGSGRVLKSSGRSIYESPSLVRSASNSRNYAYPLRESRYISDLHRSASVDDFIQHKSRIEPVELPRPLMKSPSEVFLVRPIDYRPPSPSSLSIDPRRLTYGRTPYRDSMITDVITHVPESLLEGSR